MLINEVETKVGLSKKSIRFYEEHHLLSPKRNGDNRYRIYDEEDVKKLKTIKFLRELNVSIRDLQLLSSGEISLQECMNERVKKIEEENRNYQRVKKMCEELALSQEKFSDIDITKYLEEMNRLNKKGFSMKKSVNDHGRKIFGACLSSFIFGALFLFMIILISLIKFSDEGMPIGVYVLFMSIFSIPLIGIISNLVMRIKEIKSGEEDEAKKY